MPRPNAGDPLTERETEILGLAAAGSSNRYIARRLEIAEDTVKSGATSC